MHVSHMGTLVMSETIVWTHVIFQNSSVLCDVQMSNIYYFFEVKIFKIYSFSLKNIHRTFIIFIHNHRAVQWSTECLLLPKCDLIPTELPILRPFKEKNWNHISENTLIYMIYPLILWPELLPSIKPTAPEHGCIWLHVLVLRARGSAEVMNRVVLERIWRAISTQRDGRGVQTEKESLWANEKGCEHQQTHQELHHGISLQRCGKEVSVA